MIGYIKQKSFGDRMKDTGYLLKNSFTIIGANTGIVKPTIHMAVYSLLLTTLVFVAFTMFLSRWHIGTGCLILFFTVLVMLPYKFFYWTRQKACQSWMTYQAVTGKTTPYPDALRHIGGEKRRLRIIALVDVLIAYAGSRRGEKTGFLENLFLSVLVEVWDLVNHYMIPSVVIEQKGLNEVIPQLKKLRHNVPATLTGVFGIDFVGDVIKVLLGPVYMGTLLAGVGLSYLLGPVIPNTSWMIHGHLYTWVPVVILLYFSFCAGGVLKSCMESIKTIYFTIFYTSIARPEAIAPGLRQELTHYLLMGDAAAGGASGEVSTPT